MEVRGGDPAWVRQMTPAGATGGPRDGSCTRRAQQGPVAGCITHFSRCCLGKRKQEMYDDDSRATVQARVAIAVGEIVVVERGDQGAHEARVGIDAEAMQRAFHEQLRSAADHQARALEIDGR